MFIIQILIMVKMITFSTRLHVALHHDAHDHVGDVHFAFRRCLVDHADNVLFIGDGNHDCGNFCLFVNFHKQFYEYGT